MTQRNSALFEVPLRPNPTSPSHVTSPTCDLIDFGQEGISWNNPKPTSTSHLTFAAMDFSDFSDAMKTIAQHVTLLNNRQATSAPLPPLPNLSFGNYPDEQALLFMEHFRSFCVFGQFSDLIKLRIFPMLLRDEAYLWYQDQGPFSSFSDLEIAFINHFSPAEDETKYLCELYSTVQEMTEPITQFITRVRQVNQLLRKRMTEQQLLPIVQQNLNPKLKLDIAGRSFTTLYELQRAVLEIDVLRQQLRACHPSNNKTPAREIFSSTCQLQQQRAYRNVSFYQNRRCWSCDQTGHISRFCPRHQYQRYRKAVFHRNPKKARNVQRRYFQLRRQQQVLQQVLKGQHSFTDISVGLYINGSYPVKAIIDTVSDISVIHEWLLNIIHCPFIPDVSNVTAIDIQGNTIPMSGSVVLTFRLGNKWWKHKFHITSECNEDIYLGKDFLLEKEIVIDCPQSRLLYHNTQIPFWTPHTFDSLPVTDINTIIDDKLQEVPVRASQREDLKKLFKQFPSVFNPVTGRTSIIQHEIKIKPGTKPIHKPPYRVSDKKQKIIDECIIEMKREGVITESTSPWSAPVLVVPKKDGGFRFCVDYRQLNAVTINDPFPIPHIDDILNNVPNPKFITKLDLRNGYWQIELDQTSREKTAFCIRGAKYEFVTMPFGLMSAPSTFQRLMNHVLRDGARYGVSVYLDDILILSCSWEEHLSALKYVLEQLSKHNLTLRLKKCSIAEPKTKILGYILNEKGLHMDPDKIETIEKFPAPKNKKDIQRFLGMTGWHHKFISNYALLTAPLSKLTRKSEKWQWKNEQEQAFQTIKHKIAAATQLNIIQIGAPLIITTDASDVGLGAVLSQIQEGQEKPLAYASRLLHNYENNYSTTEKECLAVVWAIKKFNHYLDGTPFDIYTDHHSLCWLLNIKDPSSRLARWALRLQEYQYKIHHRNGKTNVVADYLSRPPITLQEIRVLDNQDGFFHTFTSEEIRIAQENDPRIINIRQAIQNGNTRHELDEQGVVWLKAYKQFPRTIELPSSLVNDVLRTYHTHPGAGHRGRDTTLNRIRANFAWPHVYRDVTRYVQQCETCQQYAFKNRKPSGLMGLTKASEPWQLVGVDLMGPFPVSATQKRFLLVVIDYFTKWTELIPLSRATAEHVTPAVMKIILRWGCPQHILSDLGRNFISNLWRGTCALLKINTSYTTPYHPQTNFTERVNKVIGNAIAKYVGTNHRKWDESLHFIQASINSAIHESTGFSPGYLNFGRSYRMPWDPMLHHLSVPEVDYELYERESLTKLRDNLELSKEFQLYMQQKNKELYDERRQDIEFEEGQVVWRETNPISNRAAGFMAKLAPKWEGPFKIQRKLSPLTYVLGKLHTMEPAGTWHADKLKVFHNNTDILQELNNEHEMELFEDSEDEDEIDERPPEMADLEPTADLLIRTDPLIDNPLLRPLRQGWIRKVIYRHRPSVTGKAFDVYYTAPQPYNETIRSMKGLSYFLAIHPEINLQLSDFSCNSGPIGATDGEIVIHRD